MNTLLNIITKRSTKTAAEGLRALVQEYHHTHVQNRPSVLYRIYDYLYKEGIDTTLEKVASLINGGV